MQVNEPYLCFSLETIQQRDNLSLEKGVLVMYISIVSIDW